MSGPLEPTSDQPQGANDAVIAVGERFATFEALDERMTKFSDANCVQLWKRDARTIGAAKKRAGKIASRMPEELKYYQLRYCCIHGGAKFVTSSKGARKSSTFKKDCGFNVYIAANKEGSHLEVRSLTLEHNHTVVPEFFKHLPQQRRLPPELQAKARTLLKLKANKMMVRQEMQKESGNAILLKDLSNIAAKGKDAKERNNLPEVVRALQEKHHATVRVLTDENDELQAIYFQDDQMKRSFQDCPEVLFIDATYKLLETRMACFLVIIENSNGESEIVSVGLFTTEDAGTLRWFFEAFKSLNPKWESVRVTMADKDVKERSVVKQLFPSSALHICSFHTLQAFRREVSVMKLGVTRVEQETALDILQRMVYAKSEEEYQELYALLQTSAARAVVEYFDDNWHTIHEEWVMGRKWLCGNFFNATNNRAENMNSKLKQLVERFSSLEMFVERFFTMIHAQRNEKKHKAAVMLQKQRVDTASDEASELYSKLLTPYAFNRVKEELCEATRKMSVDALADAHRFSATARGCTCTFRQAMLLPCRHIFTVRDHLGISKFEKDVCAKRWFLDVYVQSCGLTQNNECAGEELVQVSSRKDERILSAHQKFRKAAAIASTLADLASDCATPRFKERLKVLESILQSWRHNVEVTVTSCAPCTSNGVDTQSECLLDQHTDLGCPGKDQGASNQEKLWSAKRPDGYRYWTAKKAQEDIH
ncbi:zinc finger SWIM domain-containing protein 1-like [Ixodes scapularis]|uniref:zinc finger SWIM domain-containing protein 1-like n=1 Tax=Ixodes scapularis TaxID=6945 RepID=UPI001A9EA9D7|nr:zinc finger SWIM domain-containing protein 1-like [Ixodes scapularis]